MSQLGPQQSCNSAIIRREDLWRKEWRGSRHRGPATKLVALPWGGKYASAGKDGIVRVWGPDLRPLQALPYAADGASPAASSAGNGAWATDAARLLSAGQERLIVSSMDRSLSIFNVLLAEKDPDRPDERSCLGNGGRLVMPVAAGPALCLAAVPAAAAATAAGVQHLALGTAAGVVAQLLCPLPSMAETRPLQAGRDLVTLHKEHSGWVTQLVHAPEVGLLSSSLDATVKVFDPERGAVTATSRVHARGVRCMAYSSPLSLMLSGGTERSVLLWHPRGDPSHKVGELPSHAAGVAAVALAEHQHQAFTLAGDGAIAAWDLRTLRQLQRVERGDWPDAEDSRPAAMVYDPSAGRLVTATRRPAAWRHSLAAAGEAGHSSQPDAALDARGGGGAGAAPRQSVAAASGDAVADSENATSDEAGESGASAAWIDPPLWIRPHSRLYLGAIPSLPGLG